MVAIISPPTVESVSQTKDERAACGPGRAPCFQEHSGQPGLWCQTGNQKSLRPQYISISKAADAGGGSEMSDDGNGEEASPETGSHGIIEKQRIFTAWVECLDSKIFIKPYSAPAYGLEPECEFEGGDIETFGRII